jgi:hypothetical protein
MTKLVVFFTFDNMHWSPPPEVNTNTFSRLRSELLYKKGRRNQGDLPVGS